MDCKWPVNDGKPIQYVEQKCGCGDVLTAEATEALHQRGVLTLTPVSPSLPDGSQT